MHSPGILISVKLDSALREGRLRNKTVRLCTRLLNYMWKT